MATEDFDTADAPAAVLGSASAATVAPVIAPAQQPAAFAPAAGACGNLWAVVSADRTLMTAIDDGLVFPENEPLRSYPLDLDESLVGRRNSKAGLHPEIPVADPSVSSRHLKICRRRDGSGLYLVDVGSSNGTQINGAVVDVGVETPINPGDQIVVGAWTRIIIESR